MQFDFVPRAVYALLLSLVMISSACDDEPSTTSIDAAALDASDASEIDAAIEGEDSAVAEDATAPELPGAATVNVTTIDGTAIPVVDARVVFLDAAGALIAEQQTDALGRATAVVERGASVTVIRPRADGADTTTVLDIAPGDSLDLGREVGAAPGIRGTMTFTFTGFPGATQYSIAGSCGARGNAMAEERTITVTFFNRCELDSYDLTLTAYGGIPRAYARLDDRVFIDGETAAFPDTWEPAQSCEATFTNAADLSYVNLGRHDILDGFSVNTSDTTFLMPGTESTRAYPCPSRAPEVATSIYFKRGMGEEPQGLFERHPSTTTAYTFDAGAELLPWVSSIEFDPAEATITWNQDGSRPFDGKVIDTRYERMTNTGVARFRWRVIASPSDTRITLPTLPASAFDIAPHAGDTVKAFVMLADTEATSYDAFRARADFGADLWYEGDAENPFAWFRTSGALQ